jgi:hypothetical protein
MLWYGPANGGCGRTGPCPTPTRTVRPALLETGACTRCEWHAIGNTGGLDPAGSPDRSTGVTLRTSSAGVLARKRSSWRVRLRASPRQPVARWKREPSLSCQASSRRPQRPPCVCSTLGFDPRSPAEVEVCGLPPPRPQTLSQRTLLVPRRKRPHRCPTSRLRCHAGSVQRAARSQWAMARACRHECGFIHRTGVARRRV